MNEIDPEIRTVLDQARLVRADVEGDWQDVLARSARTRGRRPHLRFSARGVLLAAALLVGLSAVAQAETGVFHFIGLGSSRQRREAQEQRVFTVSDAAYGSILAGLPRGQVTGISVIPNTTGAKVASVFGVPTRRYPGLVGVVVMKGPFSIPLYLQGCQGTPAICPVPVGHWAWISYAVLPEPRKGPMSGLVNARWIRIAPTGTPLPKVARLGRVIHEHYFPSSGRSIVARQHQGILTVVVRRGTRLTEGHLPCRYQHRRYTTAVCEALARYVASLGQSHPDETPPATGDWTRVTGDLGGWRGNLIITPASLRQAPPALHTAVERGLASIHGVAITKVPPGLDCVVNPIPCYRTTPATTDNVVDAINRHGFDLRHIQPGEIPARFTGHLPSGAHIVGAATNAGDPAVAGRGFMLTIVFDRKIPFSTRLRNQRMLDRTWGVFVTGNCLTFYHPFYTPAPVRNVSDLTPHQLQRALRRFQAQQQIDHRKSRRGWMVERLMRALTRTR